MAEQERHSAARWVPRVTLAALVALMVLVAVAVVNNTALLLTLRR